MKLVKLGLHSSTEIVWLLDPFGKFQLYTPSIPTILLPQGPMTAMTAMTQAEPLFATWPHNPGTRRFAVPRLVFLLGEVV